VGKPRETVIQNCVTVLAFSKFWPGEVEWHLFHLKAAKCCLNVMAMAPQGDRLPEVAREALAFLVEQLRMVQVQINGLEKKLMAWHHASEASQRLETIPGVGVITATALVATIGDASQFHSGRQLAAWLGLVPKQHSSGGKERLGRISKRGDGYLRKLLVHGARTVLLWSRRKKENRSAWQEALLARRPTNVVLVAMANKTARVVWAMLSRGETFRPEASVTA
jgi:transposase